MPIKGLTDRADISFPKIGDIRKGEPKDEKGHVGKDLTYFRAEFIEGEEVAAERFDSLYGTEPREIDVVLPFSDIDRVWETWQEEHVTNQLIHRCDGETCVLWYDKATDTYHTTPKPCPGGCSPVGRLKVIIPALRRLAYVEVHTTSVNDLIEITRNLKALQAMRSRDGETIKGVPLVLKRRPRVIPCKMPQKNGPDKRVRQKKWLLSIEAEPDWVAAQITAMQHDALPVGYVMPALTAGQAADELFDEDDDAIPGEYYRDEIAGNGFIGEVPPDPTTAEEPTTTEPAATTEIPPCPEYPANLALRIKDGTFFDAVVDRIGYEHVGAVKTALLAIRGKNGWKDADLAEYWAQLWDHKHAPTTD